MLQNILGSSGNSFECQILETPSAVLQAHLGTPSARRHLNHISVCIPNFLP